MSGVHDDTSVFYGLYLKCVVLLQTDGTITMCIDVYPQGLVMTRIGVVRTPQTEQVCVLCACLTAGVGII